MRILIIEDNNEIRNFLVTSFKTECFAVDSAEDGTQGSYLARTNDYDVIILDNILPGKHGNVICQEIRQSGKHSPIIMLSVESDVDKKISLLECGADDYVTKPFSYEELRARVKALLRRPKRILEEVLVIADLLLDSGKQTVVRDGKDIYLTRKEFSLTEYLMRHSGYVVSRGMIMEHVWNVESDPFSNTIEAHILNLRKKIDRGRDTPLIHTVPGRGYKIDLAP